MSVQLNITEELIQREKAKDFKIAFNKAREYVEWFMSEETNASDLDDSISTMNTVLQHVGNWGLVVRLVDELSDIDKSAQAHLQHRHKNMFGKVDPEAAEHLRQKSVLIKCVFVAKMLKEIYGELPESDSQDGR